MCLQRSRKTAFSLLTYMGLEMFFATVWRLSYRIQALKFLAPHMVSFIVLLQLVVVTSDLDMGVNVAWVSSLVLCVPWDIPVLLLQYDGLVCCNKYSLSFSLSLIHTHKHIHIYIYTHAAICCMCTACHSQDWAIHSVELIHPFAFLDYMTHPLGIQWVCACICVCACMCACMCTRVLRYVTGNLTLSLLHTPLCSFCDPFYTSYTLLLPMTTHGSKTCHTKS